MQQRLNWSIASVLVAIIAVTATYGQGRLEGRGATKRFDSEKYGFSVAVPPGWLVDPSGDTPIFFSFTPAEAQDFNRQLRLPKGGAVISIVADASLPGAPFRNLPDWASADAKGASTEAPSIRRLPVASETGISAAIISSFDTATYGPQDQSEHHVSIFWEFNHALFATHLLYPAHDAKGLEFERILANNIRSIRPLHKYQKR
jgi:hypothetical protein